VDVAEHDSFADAVTALLRHRPGIVWTYLDPELYNSARIRSLLLAALRQGVPVFGFSVPSVRAGALLGVGIEPAEQGEQLAQLREQWSRADPTLKSTVRGRETAHRPPRSRIAVNRIVAEQLGIDLSESILNEAHWLFSPE
jgi:ABC-type uncharacterized transport system substrate-binding protein